MHACTLKKNLNLNYLYFNLILYNSRKKSAASVMNWKVNPYPEPPPEEYANFKMTEERKLAKVKEHKQKTDAIIQRRK